MKVAIVSNGFADGPAQALRDYLVARGDDVVTIFHPLTAEQGTRHVIASYAHGACVRERAVSLPLRPPFSYGFDPLVPLLPPRVDAWFGFNPLACARGLAARTRRRAGFVGLWSVDFVPDRFGTGTLVTRLYDRLDRVCCLRADARVELSAAARDARNRRHALPPERSGAHIVPMGAWVERAPPAGAAAFRRRRVVFLGHLVDRQGVATLLDALARVDGVDATIVGTGPLEPALRARADALGLLARVDFRGFVERHEEVERLLAASAVAVAPYVREGASFTRFADPGKLKAYLAAGLPIVTTDVPPNAAELAREAGAEIVADDPDAIAGGIRRALASEQEWQARSAAARSYATRFDWNTLLGELLQSLRLGD